VGQDTVASSTSRQSDGKESFGYYETSVQSLLASTKNKFSQQLSGEQLAPFRSYVDALFPVLTEDQVVAGTVGFREGHRVISTELADTQFREALRVASKISEITRYVPALLSTISMDLTVVTIPSGAKIQLQPASGGRISTTTSDSKFRNIYRGYYQYSVVLSGFKDIVNGIVNLIDDDRDTLECSLIRIEDRSRPSSCVRK